MRIRELQERRGISQSELARRMGVKHPPWFSGRQESDAGCGEAAQAGGSAGRGDQGAL